MDKRRKINRNESNLGKKTGEKMTIKDINTMRVIITDKKIKTDVEDKRNKAAIQIEETKKI